MRFHRRASGLLAPERELVPPGVCEMLMGMHYCGFGGGHAPTEVLINQTLPTTIGNMTAFAGIAAAFDGVTNAASGSDAAISGAPGYVGKSYAAGHIFSKALLYGSNSLGYSTGGGTPSVTIAIYGKNGSDPASGTDGTQVGTITFTNTANESSPRTILSTDTATAWTRLWAYITGPASPGIMELQLFELI